MFHQHKRSKVTLLTDCLFKQIWRHSVNGEKTARWEEYASWWGESLSLPWLLSVVGRELQTSCNSASNAAWTCHSSFVWILLRKPNSARWQLIGRWWAYFTNLKIFLISMGFWFCEVVCHQSPGRQAKKIQGFVGKTRFHMLCILSGWGKMAQKEKTKLSLHKRKLFSKRYISSHERCPLVAILSEVAEVTCGSWEKHAIRVP